MRRRVQCSMEILGLMMHGNLRAAQSDLPEDAEVVDVFTCADDRITPGVFSIVLKSAEWEKIGPGCRIPLLVVTMRSKAA